MKAYTTITSENDGIEIVALIDKEGKYHSPAVTFFNLLGEWRTNEDLPIETWDNDTYLIDDLYPEIVRACNIGICDIELRYMLEESKVSMYELKDMLTEAIAMGFFESTTCEFFD